MDNVRMHVVNGFTYHVDAVKEMDSRYRGQIFIYGREGTGEFFTPPIKIRTPATFKTERAASIEAESYCYEILLNGDIVGFVAVAESYVTKIDECVR